MHTMVIDINAAPQLSFTPSGVASTINVISSAICDAVVDNTTENNGKDTGNPEDVKTCAKRSAADFECDTKDKKMRA